MADTRAYAAISHLKPGDITLTPNQSAPRMMRLDLGTDVHIVLDSGAADAAQQAAAMRRLAEVATEAADWLERTITKREDGSGEQFPLP
jgi:hypothetical protein